ncbi:hypothetical protein, partial [Mycobacterium tuberculosis]
GRFSALSSRWATGADERRFTAADRRQRGGCRQLAHLAIRVDLDGRKDASGRPIQDSPGRLVDAGIHGAVTVEAAELALKEFCLGACVAGIRAIPGLSDRAAQVNQ